MSFEAFDERIRKVIAQKPSWFQGVEAPANKDDIAFVEGELKLPLPEQFRHFAEMFGAGYFGSGNISSLVNTSAWYVLSRPSVMVNGKSMLVVSDDEAGGYFGFLLDGEAYGSKVVYIHPDDGNYSEVVSATFFEYIEDIVLMK